MKQIKKEKKSKQTQNKNIKKKQSKTNTTQHSIQKLDIRINQLKDATILPRNQ